MSYVLTIIRQPEKGAAFGRATCLPPVDMTEMFDSLCAYMTEHFGSLPPVNVVGSLAFRLVNDPLGTVIYDPATGADFRLDPAENAPHPCPCGAQDPDPCGRVVLPGDHAYADDPESFCLGCWGDTVNEGCLPANTAHPITD